MSVYSISLSQNYVYKHTHKKRNIFRSDRMTSETYYCLKFNRVVAHWTALNAIAYGNPVLAATAHDSSKLHDCISNALALIRNVKVTLDASLAALCKRVFASRGETSTRGAGTAPFAHRYPDRYESEIREAGSPKYLDKNDLAPIKDKDTQTGMQNADLPAVQWSQRAAETRSSRVPPLVNVFTRGYLPAGWGGLL